MNLSSAIIGTSFYFNPGPPPPSGPIDLGAGYGPPANPNTGFLLKSRYPGYHGDNMSFFNSASLFGQSADGLVIADDSTEVNGSYDNYSLMWTGYIFAPAGGQYRINTTSDDGSYLWIGDNAINNWTTSTAIVSNGGAHGSTTVTGTDVLMVGGRWYPIRMVFGELSGGAVFNTQIEIVGSGTGPITPLWAYNTTTGDGF